MVVDMFGLSKITVYLFIAVLSVGAITTTYFVWKHNIRQQALAEFNMQQMEQTAKDQAEFMRQQQEIAAQQAAAARALTQQNEALGRRMGSIDRFLSSSQTQDRPASDVIKQTLDRLRTENQQ
jgi:hypothetical protein